MPIPRRNIHAPLPPSIREKLKPDVKKSNGSFAVSPSGAANYTISIQVPPLTPHSALADLVPPHSGIARAAVLSRATMRNIRQQLAFACRYNSLRHNRDRL